MTDVTHESEPRGGFRLSGEAVVLAVSPVAAYVMAFSFEAGFAERMGYPTWVIQIEPANVALAWGALAIGAAALYAVASLVASWLPVSILRVLLSRVSVFSGLFVWLAWNLPPSGSEGDPRVGVGLILVVGLGMLVEAILAYRGYQDTDPTLGFWGRLAAATSAVSEEFRKYEERRRESPRSLYDHSEGLRLGMSGFLVLLIVAGALVLPTSAWGRVRAGQERSFFVSADADSLEAC